MKRFILSSLVALAVVGAPTVPAAAAPAGLDPSFAEAGFLQTGFTPQAAAVDPAGQMLIAGGTEPAGAVTLTRYTSIGELDSTFGDGGTATFSIAPSSDELDVVGMYVEADGAIVLAGTSSERDEANSEGFVARAEADGQGLDGRFGAGGVAWLSHGSRLSALAEGSQERPIVVGSLEPPPGRHEGRAAYLVRLTNAGQPDASFGHDGVVAGLGGRWGAVERLMGVTASEGAITVTGGGDAMLVARYDESGQLVRSFGTRGLVHILGGAAGSLRTADAIAPLPGGAVLIAGSPSRSENAYLARLTATGRFDSGFGLGGVALVDLAGAPAACPGRQSSAADAIALEPGGDVVLAGSVIGSSPLLSAVQRRARPASIAECASGVPGSFALARFTQAGALDCSFGSSGTLRQTFRPLAGTEPRAFHLDAAEIDAEGRLLIAGWEEGGGYTGVVARFLLGGAPPGGCKAEPSAVGTR